MGNDLLIIYLPSLVLAWIMTRYDMKKSNDEPSALLVFIVLCPFLNTVVGITLLFAYIPYDKLIRKFFLMK